jgi:hypothetical protein
MTKDAYYNHLTGQRYRCEVIEETGTMVKVRLSEETARELKFTTELWLPKTHVTIEGA